MLEPWEYKSNDNRDIDSLPTYIIFCEDQVSEPEYFKFFETSLIKINCIKGQKSRNENLSRTIEYCIENKIIQYIDGKLNRIDEEINIWCVYDRDKNFQKETFDKTYHLDIDYNNSIEYADQLKINTAWSNDAFELWILLHFENVDKESEATKSRAYYYDRLTDIFKNLDSPNYKLAKCREVFSSFNYKKDLKSQKNFKDIVLPHIIKSTNEAIKRAKELNNYFTNKNFPHHEMVPCTQVYKLVEELITKGGKEF